MAGEVHQLILKAESTGYLMQFRDGFYFPHDKASNQQLRKASNINNYQLDTNEANYIRLSQKRPWSGHGTSNRSVLIYSEKRAASVFHYS
jgi:hypothetical protein